MADTVQYLLEAQLPELEDYERKGYFTRPEIKQVGHLWDRLGDSPVFLCKDWRNDLADCSAAGACRSSSAGKSSSIASNVAQLSRRTFSGAPSRH